MTEAEIQQWIDEIDQQVEDGLFTEEEGEAKKQALRKKIPA